MSKQWTNTTPITTQDLQRWEDNAESAASIATEAATQAALAATADSAAAAQSAATAAQASATAAANVAAHVTDATTYDLARVSGAPTIDVSDRYAAITEIQGVPIHVKVTADMVAEYSTDDFSVDVVTSSATTAKTITGLQLGYLCENNILTVCLLSDGKFHVTSSEKNYISATDEDVSILVADENYRQSSQAEDHIPSIGQSHDLTMGLGGKYFANALKGAATGTNIVRMDNVSPLSHKIPVSGVSPSGTVKAYSKNILPVTKTESHTINGVTFTINPDGSVRAQGTAVGSTASFNINESADSPFVPPGTYTLSGGISADVKVRCYFRTTPEPGTTVETKDSYYSSTMSTYRNFTTTQGYYFYTSVNVGVTGQPVDVTFYPQLELGASPTAYEPYKAPVPYTADTSGVTTIDSVAPVSTIIAEGNLSATYNKDINAVVSALTNAILTLGGTINV